MGRPGRQELDEVGHGHGVGALERPGALDGRPLVVDGRQRTAATSPANAGATDCVPSPITNGGDAVAPSTVAASHDPPGPYACVERTMACSSPLFATASSASPFARR